jgi:hypothetical protein
MQLLASKRERRERRERMTASLAANLPPWERVAPAAPIAGCHEDVAYQPRGQGGTTNQDVSVSAQLGLRGPRGLIGFVPSG